MISGTMRGSEHTHWEYLRSSWNRAARLKKFRRQDPTVYNYR